jgi:hypothetical protein
MKKIKTGAIHCWSWIKGVNVTAAIKTSQLQDKKNIILDQLLLSMPLEDSIALFKSVRKEFDDIIYQREIEVNHIKSVIEDYKKENPKTVLN